MFSTNEHKGKVSPVFFTGWNKCKVESIEVREAKSGRKQLIFRVYGEPVNQEGFKPWKKQDGTLYEGQCGTIVTSYFKDTEPGEVAPLMNKVIKPMLTAYGVKTVFDSRVNSDTTFSEFVEVLNELLTGNELPYVWMNFNGEEYERPGKDRPGVKLYFKAITNDEKYKENIPAGELKKITLPTETSVEGNLY